MAHSCANCAGSAPPRAAAETRAGRAAGSIPGRRSLARRPVRAVAGRSLRREAAAAGAHRPGPGGAVDRPLPALPHPPDPPSRPPAEPPAGRGRRGGTASCPAAPDIPCRRAFQNPCRADPPRSGDETGGGIPNARALPPGRAATGAFISCGVPAARKAGRPASSTQERLAPARADPAGPHGGDGMTREEAPREIPRHARRGHGSRVRPLIRHSAPKSSRFLRGLIRPDFTAEAA